MISLGVINEASLEFPEEGRDEFFLRTMMIAREADNRENKLFCQGRGQLHVSTAGHEAIVGVAPHVRKEDVVYCYYRDRALMLGMGIPLYDLALDYFAKAQSSSAGRQMANHFSYKSRNVMSSASPTGLQCLPAAGTAWGIKENNSQAVVYCLMGEACTRQGEFYEALSFSLQESLPIIFLVEDNGYGISTSTKDMNPLCLGMLPQEITHVMEGRDPCSIHDALGPIVEAVRVGGGPKVIWLKLDRLMSHTSSDDQTRYRRAEELARIKERDPLKMFNERMLSSGRISEKDILSIKEDVIAMVNLAYAEAEQAEEPDVNDIRKHLFSSSQIKTKSLNIEGFSDATWRMSSAINYTLDTLLRENDKTILFGEDIADPKGGVFGLTKSLSTRYPGRVVNSPLAEATIAGVASGLSLAGFMPIFELQFIDFVGPAFHQIVNQIATLRWRSAGKYQCPLVLYAPCGGYIANGGPWHTQTNESWFAHVPGLKVYMPSNANDAAHLLYAAASGQDPVLMLLPKSQFQTVVKKDPLLKLYPEKATVRRVGEHITLVAWGNCIELCMQAAKIVEQQGINLEVIDLGSIVPCDWQTIHHSVQKTGRLIVVQEDGRTCSFGQTIISELTGQRDLWDRFYAPPQLVTKEDIYLGFNKNLEAATLPSVAEIIEKISVVLGGI